MGGQMHQKFHPTIVVHMLDEMFEVFCLIGTPQELLNDLWIHSQEF